MDIKQVRILLAFITVMIFTCIFYFNKDKGHDYITDENVVDEQINEESILKSEQEWYPVPVVSCEEIFKNQYHITFENGVTILTNKPAKVGDTTKCWINGWYDSKIDKSLDSMVFENPY